LVLSLMGWLVLSLMGWLVLSLMGWQNPGRTFVSGGRAREPSVASRVTSNKWRPLPSGR
jgi:hypothetical protein